MIKHSTNRTKLCDQNPSLVTLVHKTQVYMWKYILSHMCACTHTHKHMHTQKPGYGRNMHRGTRSFERGLRRVLGACPAHQSDPAVRLCSSVWPWGWAGLGLEREKGSEQDCAHPQLMIGPTVLSINHSDP